MHSLLKYYFFYSVNNTIVNTIKYKRIPSSIKTWFLTTGIGKTNSGINWLLRQLRIFNILRVNKWHWKSSWSKGTLILLQENT